MVYAVLPGLEHHIGRDAGDVTHEPYAVRVRRFVQGQVSFAVCNRPNLQKIELPAGQRCHDSPRLLRGSDRNPRALERLDSVLGGILSHALDVLRGLEERAGHQDPRSDASAFAHIAAPPQQFVVIASHVAQRGDAIGDEEAERRRARFRQMGVELDVPGEQEFAGPVDDVVPGGRSTSAAGASAAMRSSRTRTVMACIGAAPVAGMTVTFRIAKSRAGAVCGNGASPRAMASPRASDRGQHESRRHRPLRSLPAVRKIIA